jgi:hypothetical protein
MKRSLLWTKTPEEIEAEKAQMAEALIRLGKMAASGVGMSCGRCGHFDDMARFTATAVFGELPRNQFQCPACGWAAERKHGAPTVYPSGFVAPGAVTLAPVGARL